MSKKNLIYLVILVVIVGLFYYFNNKRDGTVPVVCTMEAKICPDGTVVGRSGPKCEFVCPTEAKVVAHFNEKVLNNAVYITPLTLISDSRCPVDVQCVWAGTVEIIARLQIGDQSKDVKLSLGRDYAFSGKTVKFVGVEPSSKNSKEVIKNSDYIFEFYVK